MKWSRLLNKILITTGLVVYQLNLNWQHEQLNLFGWTIQHKDNGLSINTGTNNM